MARFLTACLYITDNNIREKALELGMDNLSRSDISKIKDHLRLIAQAYASAELQDAERNDFEFWLSEDDNA